MSLERTVAELAAAELGAEGARGALPFVAAVAAQLGSPLEVGGRSPSVAGERASAGRALGVLRLAASSTAEAGALLAADPALLAAFFGNVDLLYDAGWPGADAVSLAVVHALGLLEEPAPG